MRRKDRRGRKKIRGHEDVELNVAAMLDMAFQLLAFFILTFKPSPIESQIMMRLPDKAVTQAPSNSVSVTDVVDEGLAVQVSIYSTPEGEIEKLVLGDRPLSAPTLEELMTQFRADLAAIIGLGSDTVNIRVGEDLRYERLMMVVDICGNQKLESGERLSKVSIVPLKTN
ncbi:MAG: biopolymer transporter ExbD [Pirellulaceae bacterium]|nr:biopolymer transporter ExbD [Pirellulaceae bacterium]